MRNLAVCILAAGKGKRMGNPDLAKVLTPLAGRPLLGYVLETAAKLDPSTTVVIAGHQREAVSSYTLSQAPSTLIAIQDQQLGTGHAVMQTRSMLADSDTDVIILSGDVPLLRSTTLQHVVHEHQRSGAALTVLTTRVADPTGYGRIVRNADASLAEIVEHKDATPEQLAITEINSGIYVVHSAVLFSALDQLKNNNAQGEYYLTDIVGILLSEGHRVEAVITPDSTEVHGINSPADLERAAAILEERVSV